MRYLSVWSINSGLGNLKASISVRSTIRHRSPASKDSFILIYSKYVECGTSSNLTTKRWKGYYSSRSHYRRLFFDPRFLCWASVAENFPADESRKVAERHEFDNIQNLIVSPPDVSHSQFYGSQLPTLLELEAEALEGANGITRRERIEAMNGVLDLVEQAGLAPGYAFEFVRYAGELIDELIVEAKGRFGNVSVPEPVQSWDKGIGPISGVTLSEQADIDLSRTQFIGNLPNSRVSRISRSMSISERERKLGMVNRLLQFDSASESASHPLTGGHDMSTASLAARVSYCAEDRSIGRLVFYFHLLGMKAFEIPKVVVFAGQRVDLVIAKVEFLRSLGLQYGCVLSVLVRYPQLLSYDCDSLAVKVDYMIQLGLSLKEIGKMVIELPQILSRDLRQGLLASVETLQDLGVPWKGIKGLVFRFPILLTQDAAEKLNPLVNYLEQIGVQRKNMGKILVRRPLLLETSVENDLTSVGNYLMTLHASPDDIDKIITSSPQLFSYDVEQVFRPTVSYLEGLGVEPALMGKLLRRHPQLFKNRHNFEQKVEFLLNLGLEPKDLGKVIYNAPQLLSLSIHDNLLPTVKFLGSIGIKGSSLQKVLKMKPMILAYSVESKLKQNLKFLKSIKIKTAQLGRLVARYPQLLTLSVEKNLKPTIAYLIKLGYTRAEIADMVRRLPSLLGFNVVTVLAPKYGYLVDVMKRSGTEVVRFPQYFSYSLSGRIIPRHEQVQNTVIHRSLNSMYGCNDLVFEKRLRKWMAISEAIGLPQVKQQK